jgi:chromosome segregation ATPase
MTTELYNRLTSQQIQTEALKTAVALLKSHEPSGCEADWHEDDAIAVAAEVVRIGIALAALRELKADVASYRRQLDAEATARVALEDANREMRQYNAAQAKVTHNQVAKLEARALELEARVVALESEKAALDAQNEALEAALPRMMALVELRDRRVAELCDEVAKWRNAAELTGPKAADALARVALLEGLIRHYIRVFDAIASDAFPPDLADKALDALRAAVTPVNP